MCGFWMQNNDLWTGVSIRPIHDLSFCACKTAWFAPERKVYMGSSPHLCFLFMQNIDFMTRLKSLYGSQTSSVVLSTHNSLLSTRIKDYMCSRPNLWFSACKTAWLASELLVSMCPSPHVWFLDGKRRLLDRHKKLPWVPDITCRCVHAKQRD